MQMPILFCLFSLLQEKQNKKVPVCIIDCLIVTVINKLRSSGRCVRPAVHDMTYLNEALFTCKVVTENENKLRSRFSSYLISVGVLIDPALACVSFSCFYIGEVRMTCHI
jgi:hypothetical protein